MLLQLAERFRLAAERHHPGMRGRAEDGHAVAESGQRIAGARAAAQVCRARAQHAGFGRVRAARAEFHDGASRGGVHHARRFGGDQGLERERGEQIGFRDLRFDDGRAHGHHRLAGEQRRAFGDRENIAREAEAAQIIEEAGGGLAKAGRPRR